MNNRIHNGRPAERGEANVHTAVDILELRNFSHWRVVFKIDMANVFNKLH